MKQREHSHVAFQRGLDSRADRGVPPSDLGGILIISVLRLTDVEIGRRDEGDEFLVKLFPEILACRGPLPEVLEGIGIRLVVGRVHEGLVGARHLVPQRHPGVIEVHRRNRHLTNLEVFATILVDVN